MKGKIAIIAALSLILLPLAVFAETEQQAAGPPPVSASLVREGDFATELAGALKLGKPKNEAEAESLLVGAGVTPKNGWISDYPVTPDVISEIQQSVIVAADGNRLPVKREEAMAALKETENSFDLAIVPGNPGPYAEGQAPTTSQYMNPNAISDYYGVEGPPVMTYYPPPPDYDYLYAWVPDPFWYDSFYFPGFFILNDFSVFVHARFHHHGHWGGHWGGVVTNHFVDPATHAVVPASATAKGFSSAGERRSAASIEGHSMNRWMASHASSPNTFRGSRAGGGFASQGSRAFNGPRPSAGALTAPSFSGSPGGRSFTGGVHGTGPSSGPSAGFRTASPSGGFHSSSSFGGFHSGGGGGGFHSGGFSRGGFHGGGGFGGGHGGGGHR